MKPRVLLLADRVHPKSNLHQHIDAVRQSRQFEWTEVNPAWTTKTPWMRQNEFDAVVTHYSISPLFDFHINAAWFDWLREFKGPKLQFLQDEYRNVETAETRLISLGTTALFTLAREESLPDLYPKMHQAGIMLVKVLPGYSSGQKRNPEAVLNQWDQRPVDIFYRSRLVAPSLGQLGYQKKRLADVLANRSDSSIRIDVSADEGRRLYGRSWQRALLNSKAVAGAEGGSSIWDYSSHAEATVQGLLDRGITDHETLLAAVANYESPGIYATSSPRIFECAAAFNAALYVEGEYDGLIYPHVHYFPINADFSNLEEAIAHVGSKDARQMIKRSYDDLVASGEYSYSKLSTAVENVLLSQLGKEENASGLGQVEGQPSKSLSSFNSVPKRRLRRAKALHGVAKRVLSELFFWANQPFPRWPLYLRLILGIFSRRILGIFRLILGIFSIPIWFLGRTKRFFRARLLRAKQRFSTHFLQNM